MSHRVDPWHARTSNDQPLATHLRGRRCGEREYMCAGCVANVDVYGSNELLFAVENDGRAAFG